MLHLAQGHQIAPPAGHLDAALEYVGRLVLPPQLLQQLAARQIQSVNLRILDSFFVVKNLAPQAIPSS